MGAADEAVAESVARGGVVAADEAVAQSLAPSVVSPLTKRYRSQLLVLHPERRSQLRHATHEEVVDHPHDEH
jgi:hypothetical protein